MIEVEFSETQGPPSDVLTGLITPEEIEVTVERRYSIPQLLQPRLSEAQAMLEER